MRSTVVQVGERQTKLFKSVLYRIELHSEICIFREQRTESTGQIVIIASIVIIIITYRETIEEKTTA